VGERERRFARDAIEAVNRHDAESLKELTDPEAEFTGLRSALEGTSYKGHEGVDEFWADTEEVWEELRFEDPEILDRDDRVLVLCTLVLRGRGSGALVEHETAWLVELRDGLMWRGRTTLDVQAAKREFEEG
jgi:ketosteroid isomerase-like protein